MIFPLLVLPFWDIVFPASLTHFTTGRAFALGKFALCGVLSSLCKENGAQSGRENQRKKERERERKGGACLVGNLLFPGPNKHYVLNISFECKILHREWEEMEKIYRDS